MTQKNDNMNEEQKLQIGFFKSFINISFNLYQLDSTNFKFRVSFALKTKVISSKLWITLVYQWPLLVMNHVHDYVNGFLGMVLA